MKIGLEQFDADGIYAEEVTLNGYDISKSTFQWSFEDFCDYHNYKLGGIV